MPPEIRDGRNYSHRANVTAHVISATAMRAIELVEKKHAGIEIHSVNHLGNIDVIDDGAK